jgi:hypothetical protein
VCGFERNAEFFGDIEREGVATEADTTRDTHKAIVKDGDVGAGRADVNDDGREMAFFGRLEDARDGIDTRLGDDWLEPGTAHSGEAIVDKRLRHGRHNHGEIVFRFVDDFVVDIERRKWHRDILLDLDFDRFTDVICLGNRDSEGA